MASMSDMELVPRGVTGSGGVRKLGLSGGDADALLEAVLENEGDMGVVQRGSSREGKGEGGGEWRLLSSVVDKRPRFVGM